MKIAADAPNKLIAKTEFIELKYTFPVFFAVSMLIATYMGRESAHSGWTLVLLLCPFVYFVYTFFLNLDNQQNVSIDNLNLSGVAHQFALKVATEHSGEFQFNVNGMTLSALKDYSADEKAAILEQLRESFDSHYHCPRISLRMSRYTSNMDGVDKDFLTSFIKECNASLTYEQLITLRDNGIDI